MIDCLGNPEPFFRQGAALSERAQFGMAPGEKGGSEHSRKDKLTEALSASRPIEERHGLLEAIDCPTIITLSLVDITERLIRQCVQDDISAGRGERKGALGGSNGLVMHAHAVEMEGQKARDPS